MPSVVTIRRYTGGMKNLIVDVRILDADPGERIEMKVALLNVAKEGAPFVGSDFQLDTNAEQLFFESFGNSPSEIEIRAFKGELESSPRPITVGIGEPSLIQEAFCLLRIVRPLVYRAFIRPIQRRKQTAGGNSEILNQMVNDTFAVDRMGQRLAYLLVPENRVSEVDADVLKRCALTGFDGCIGVALDPGEHVRFQIVLHETDASFLEFEDPNHSVWNHFENQSCKRRFSFPIRRICFQRDRSPRLD